LNGHAITATRVIIFCLLFGILFSALPEAKTTCAQEITERGITLLEAVRATLVHQPNILLQEEQVKGQKGVLQSARGEFDMTLGASAGYSHKAIPLAKQQETLQGTSKTETDTTSYRLSISKQYRAGLTVNPVVSLNRTNISSSFSDPANEARVDFLVTLPLLRDRGVQANGADEIAAEKEYEISLLELRHTISENVLNTVIAYWNYVAAGSELNQLKQSESTAKALVREIKIFIKAGARPAADLEQIQANLAVKTASRIAGEQNLFEARQYLGLSIGLPFDGLRSLPDPSHTFPRIRAQEITQLNASISDLIEQALVRRADYLSSQLQQRVKKILVKASENKLLSRLDLHCNLGYSGLDQGNEFSELISPLYTNVPGLSFSLSLDYEWPVANNSARGILLQRKSAYQQSLISTGDLARNISSGILVAISGLGNSELELARSQEAVRSYRFAMDNEKKKFKLGISTLLDLIQTEDSLTHARLNEISAQRKLSVVLARLRFETGTILSAGQKKISVNMEELTTIPLLQ
jgi:outer membrane protein